MLNKAQLLKRVNYLGATDLVKLDKPTLRTLEVLFKTKLNPNQALMLSRSVGAFGNIIEDSILNSIDFESHDWQHIHSNFRFIHIHLDGWKDKVNCDAKHTIEKLPTKLPTNYYKQGNIQHHFVGADKTQFIMYQFNESDKEILLQQYDYCCENQLDFNPSLKKYDKKLFVIQPDQNKFLDIMINAVMFWRYRAMIIKKHGNETEKQLENTIKIYSSKLLIDVTNAQLREKYKRYVINQWNSGIVGEWKGGKPNGKIKPHKLTRTNNG